MDFLKSGRNSLYNHKKFGYNPKQIDKRLLKGQLII